MSACRACNGRGKVWVRHWDPWIGLVVTYEDVCGTCYGAGIDLADEAAWQEADKPKPRSR